ncbi:hypothetical protein C8R46DRAFT_1094690 [Mycena filopes]|nr:hypothetical protein C8R46DRAFT_1094690 [Mycena filopes]
MSESEIVPAATPETQAFPGREDAKRSHNAGLAFVGRIPTEILCEIFRATVPQIPRDVDPPGSGVCEAPWRLGHICRRWRETALADAGLWATIQIYCGSSCPEYPLAALETQIARSGDASLSVVFDAMSKAGIDGPPLPHSIALLEIIVRTSHRWEKFAFEWDPRSAELVVPILSGIRGRIQRLSRIDIALQLLAAMHDMIRVAPRLRKVFLADKFLRLDDTPTVTAPWEQITHFRGRLPPKLCIEILCRTALLVECSLKIPHSVQVPPGTHVAILPHLRRLSVFIFGDQILPYLQTPNLEYLVIEPVTAVLPFIARSQCKLKGLTVFNCRAAALTSVLSHIPTLLHLQAYCIPQAEIPGAGDRLFQALADPGVCPRLESIHLSFYQTECNYDVVYDCILARKPPFKFVSVASPGEIPPDVKRKLLALAEGDSAALEVILLDYNTVAATEDMVRH